MTSTPTKHPDSDRRFSIVSAIVIYLVVGIAWVVATNLSLRHSAGISSSLLRGTGIDLLFVVLTALLAYWLLVRFTRQAHDSREVLAKSRLSEEELAKERYLVRALMESLPDSLYFKDLDSKFLRISWAHARKFRLTDPRAAIGKSDFDYFASEHAQEAYDDEQMIIRTAEPLVGKEEKAVLADGTESWVATTKLPLWDDDGRVIGTFGISRDITDRKRAEEALAYERFLLQTLMQNTTDHIYFKDAESRFTRISRAMAMRFGLDAPEDAIGKRDDDFFASEHAREAYEDEQRVIRTGQPLINKEEKEVWADGTVSWVSTTKLPLRDNDGHIVGTFGISRDITERKLAEERMDRMSQGLRAVLAAADALLACPTVDDLLRHAVELAHTHLGIERCGIYLETARREYMLGTHRVDLQGNTVSMYQTRVSIAPQDRQGRDRESWQHTRWGKTPLRHDQWDGDGDPAALPQEHVITPIFSSTGRLATFINDYAWSGGPVDEVRQDILAVYCSLLGTLIERKRAEDAMRDSETRLRRITDNMLDMICQTDVEGRLEYVSPSISSMLGYDPAVLQGKLATAIVHPDDAAMVLDARDTLGESGMARLEARARHADGHYLWLETVITPLSDEDGNRIGTIFASRDVTERKRAEEELARSNAELQQFAYVASHDLQEPLRMIASYVQLLARRYQDKLDDDANEFIGFAVDGANRMKALITDLLAYSRVGTHGKPLVPTRVEETVGRALANLQLAIEDCQGTVTCDPLPEVLADDGQLTQLFQNLIGNALKFRGEHPPIVQICARQEDNQWEFCVRDNGIGIDPQYAERIFIMFQRLHTKADYPGTGIGLAVCKKIVERHGGRIWVEGTPGEGSAFHFTLPVMEVVHGDVPALR